MNDDTPASPSPESSSPLELNQYAHVGDRDTVEELERTRQQVERLCQEVPYGRVESYGNIGKMCDPPISGYICGRIMAVVMDGAPWWRIVAKDGRLPISKRSPTASQEQRERLELEGVEFDSEGRVLKKFFVGDEEQPTLF